MNELKGGDMNNIDEVFVISNVDYDHRRFCFAYF